MKEFCETGCPTPSQCFEVDRCQRMAPVDNCPPGYEGPRVTVDRDAMAEPAAGWVTVPREPTASMVEAGRWIEYEEGSTHWRHADYAAVRETWERMLAAAPPSAPLPLPLAVRSDKSPDPLAVQVGGGHYKAMAIQPVEFIHRNGLGFCEGNAIKYLCRWRDKGGVQDLEKARHYIDLLIALEKTNA